MVEVLRRGGRGGGGGGVSLAEGTGKGPARPTNELQLLMRRTIQCTTLAIHSKIGIGRPSQALLVSRWPFQRQELDIQQQQQQQPCSGLLPPFSQKSVTDSSDRHACRLPSAVPERHSGPEKCLTMHACTANEWRRCLLASMCLGRTGFVPVGSSCFLPLVHQPHMQLAHAVMLAGEPACAMLRSRHPDHAAGVR